MNDHYHMVYMPSHHRAKVNGMVYVHILEAEKMLGRPLHSKEVVHHEDENKHNNSHENLFVFATLSDHTRYHHTGVKIKVDDYWVSPAKSRTCTTCGVEFNYKSSREDNNYFCSNSCRGESQKRAERPSKEELLALIQDKPFLEIGRMYNVSDNAIRKWCKSYELPYRKKDIKILRGSS